MWTNVLTKYECFLLNIYLKIWNQNLTIVQKTVTVKYTEHNNDELKEAKNFCRSSIRDL